MQHAPTAGRVNARGEAERALGPRGPWALPKPKAVIELLKPITWFPPMWALACGFVAAHAPLLERWPFVLGAIVLAGPLLCGTSQVVNDWFDREVDATNEPSRPIPSGRVPGICGLVIAVVWTLMSLSVAWFLNRWIFAAAALGMVLAWAYSAPPLRLKKNGWFGNAVVGICYEGLPWFTGVAALTGDLPNTFNLIAATLYSVGAFGIMILNDFKSLEGDRQAGLRSLPAQLGVQTATRLSCVVMIAPQCVVVAMLITLDAQLAAVGVGTLIVLQLVFAVRLLQDPKRLAPWYNATGTTASVLGMMITAWALRVVPAGGY